MKPAPAAPHPVNETETHSVLFVPESSQESDSKVVDLSKFDNSWYRPGGTLRRVAWYVCSTLFFKNSIPYPRAFKSSLLKLFGGKVGRNVTIKPQANIKFPWFLEVGDNVWIGEAAWIDNLAQVKIGNNVCISQGALILTGNHDYKKEAFDLLLGPIVIEDGVWVGARAVVCPGTSLSSHAVLTAGSVISGKADAWTVYAGNPAKAVRRRVIGESE